MAVVLFGGEADFDWSEDDAPDFEVAGEAAWLEIDATLDRETREARTLLERAFQAIE